MHQEQPVGQADSSYARRTACLGPQPLRLARGIGSETRKPLVIVVIGGALALAVLPRLPQPALLYLAHRGDGSQLEQKDQPKTQAN